VCVRVFVEVERSITSEVVQMWCCICLSFLETFFNAKLEKYDKHWNEIGQGGILHLPSYFKYRESHLKILKKYTWLYTLIKGLSLFILVYQVDHLRKQSPNNIINWWVELTIKDHKSGWFWYKQIFLVSQCQLIK